MTRLPQPGIQGALAVVSLVAGLLAAGCPAIGLAMAAARVDLYSLKAGDIGILGVMSGVIAAVFAVATGLRALSRRVRSGLPGTSIGLYIGGIVLVSYALLGAVAAAVAIPMLFRTSTPRLEGPVIQIIAFSCPIVVLTLAVGALFHGTRKRLDTLRSNANPLANAMPVGLVLGWLAIGILALAGTAAGGFIAELLDHSGPLM
ncbi:MAG: hypothetical protein JNN30_17220 [Rhodanobacteraceae bacterium]|nr:hypothetical protein [Rhodanobacteraceae bacterium]